MSSYSDPEMLPDPFEVGEDELDDDPPTPVARFNPDRPERSFSMASVEIGGEFGNEITIGSASEDEEEEEDEDDEDDDDDDDEEEGTEEELDVENPIFSPPLPPKNLTAFPQPQLLEVVGLLSPNLFMPIPEADPLTMLLARYVPDPSMRPRRDLSGDYAHTDLPTLIISNSWRATAKLARDSLISQSPGNIPEIMDLWALRLNSLARLRLYNQTAAECSALFGAIANIKPPEAREYILRELVPIDLELARARLLFWANDHIGYVDALMQLLRKCRRKAAIAVQGGKLVQGDATSWLDKAARVSLVLASQLVEMKQYSTATQLLETMASSPQASVELRSALALLYLQIGDVKASEYHLQIVDSSTDEKTKALRVHNQVMRAAFMADWETCTRLLVGRLDDVSTREDHVQRAMDANNLAVALLNQGQLSEGINVLEAVFKESPSLTVVAEPLIFNLATMYELRSSSAMEKKIGLLLEVAQWSGDGLRHTALKLG